MHLVVLKQVNLCESAVRCSSSRLYQWELQCGKRRRPDCSNMPGLSKESLDSDLWVNGGTVNGQGLWSISIVRIEPHT